MCIGGVEMRFTEYEAEDTYDAECFTGTISKRDLLSLMPHSMVSNLENGTSGAIWDETTNKLYRYE